MMDVGKILNIKTAKNQFRAGGYFWDGHGADKGSVYDDNNSCIVTKDVSEYLVPYTLTYLNPASSLYQLSSQM
ncbi:MAG: hypothetical protein ABJB86_01165 [Bacteroidota bacterium]